MAPPAGSAGPAWRADTALGWPAIASTSMVGPVAGAWGALSPADGPRPLGGRLQGGCTASPGPQGTREGGLEPRCHRTLGPGHAPSRPHRAPRRTVSRWPVPPPDGP